MIIDVEASQLGAIYKMHQQKMVDAGRVAALRAALRGVGVVAQDTPVDEGIAKSGWQAIATLDGAELFNDVPYASILEMGSRPHRPPLRPILEWVVRKFGLDLNNDKGSRRSFEALSDVPPETMGIAMAVVKKIELNGTEAHWMVKNNLPKLTKILGEEIDKQLARLP